ncbi:MAG: hypothetical protein EHM28_13240 [Spirochaetaceae bacterium]|nr:MAG: hypothetical protein EHM28_13240 [Spirochaetaceae bacterium]
MENISTQSQKVKGEIVQPIEQPDEKTMKKNSKIIYAVYGLIILLGLGTGYLLSTKTRAGGIVSKQSPSVIKTDKVAGSTDEVFKDSAEGVVEKGGLNGEGSHKLVREGGPSQTAYLVSSIVDLDEYVGKTVRIWGQTMAAKEVPWLMDVGKVENLSE